MRAVSSPTNLGRTTDRPTSVRYQVVFLLSLAAAIAYLARNAVGVAESSIREDLGLSLRQSGWFMGTFFWSYALLQVPGATFAQQRGTHLAMTSFAVAWSAAAICIGLSPGLWLLLAAQLLMGAAQAGMFPAACLSISHWIPLARRSFSCGCLTMGMQVGAILASVLTGALIAIIGWRWVFAVYAVPGLLWAAVFAYFFRNDPRRNPLVNESELQIIHANSIERTDDQDTVRTPSDPSGPTPWKAILSSRSVWFLCGQQMCRAAGYMFFASWFPTFLQKTQGLSVADSGMRQAFVLTGTLTGCICGGLLSDWIWNRTQSLRLSRSGVGAVCLSMCAILILTAWFVESALLAVALLSLGALFASLTGPSAYCATIDIGGNHVPQVFGLMNMMGNLAAAASPILVAELFDRTSNWGLVLVAFAVIYLTGAVCWALVDCRRQIA